MKLVRGVLAAVLLLGGMGTGQATVRIAGDRGGRIGAYVDKFQQLRASGETVIIDGVCAGACTIVLGALPREQVCLTSRAQFGFKAPSDFGANGQAIPNPGATQTLLSLYPAEVKRWITEHGGLTEHMILLPGRQLLSRYRSCSLDPR